MLDETKRGHQDTGEDPEHTSIQIYKIILLTSFDPRGGEDGWQPLQGDEVGRAAHQSCGAPSVRTTRLLKEEEEVLSDLC